MPTHPSHDDDPTAGQTRTRLPEGDAGTAARRPPRSSSRTLVTVTGVVVLLIAALAFATRGTSGGSTDDAAKNPTATPTTPTGTHPATTQTSGIPTGYPHTAEGAQSAAANFAVALGSDGMFNTSRRHEIVATVYAPGAVAGQQSQLDSAYSDTTFLTRVGLTAQGAAPSGMTLVSRADPVGSKLDTYANGNAAVEVWYSSLFGLAGNGSTNPVSESWYTDTFQLVWADGDWKVTSYSQKDGPTPVGRDQAASTAKDMTDAIREFGGFTYAR
ncbi:hypothetical protein ABZ832_24670 [Streptantibioticus parmotrematis]|uniref:hypothetical protein n=1 Tax=Streptantibioticus parmotrematis TaxID=2873249 RepID=UPI0034004BF0